MEIHGYKLGRKITETDLCSVHNAIDLETSKTVSVRIFDERLIRHPGFCNGFGRFAKSVLNRKVGVMVSLRHFAAGPDGCYAVTDYFPCLPLLQSQPQQMPPKAVLQGGIEIATTLELLHRRDLVHGALRPGNLFFNDQLQLMLGLGINRPEGKSATALPAASVAAAIYLPPEGGDGSSADWYALGVCLYQQLSGEVPFDERDQRRQQKQKLSGIDPLPETIPQSLLPLLQGLLHPDPAQRISSADAFRERAEAAGYRLSHPDVTGLQPVDAPSEAATDQPAPPSRAVQERPTTPDALSAPNTPKTRISRWVALIATLLALSTTAFFLLRDPGDDRSPPVTAQPPVSPIDPAGPATHTIRKATRKEPSVSGVPQSRHPGNEAFRQARELLASGKPDRALLIINEVLSKNPGSREALALHQSIRNELNIRSILMKAERQLQAGQLDSPPGDNALESYRSLARLLPKGDPRLQRGLSRIANRYAQLSRQAVAQHNLDKALRLAQHGIRLFPSFTPLQALHADIIRQRNTLRLEHQRQLQQQRKKERLRQIKLSQQQEQQKLSEQYKRLIRDFHEALAQKPPLPAAIDRAMARYDELRRLNTPDEQLRPLRQRLIEARIALSEQQIEQGRFEAANRNLQLGLELGDESGLLHAQINRLQEAIQQHRKARQAAALLDEAEALLSSGNAALEDLERAQQLLDQAGRLDPGNRRTQSLDTRLLRSYDQQAAAALESGRLDEADAYIGQGLARSSTDQALLARQRQLLQARKKEQERRSVPIIGTF